MAKIQTNINDLWKAYAGSAQSGRFSCPVKITNCGQDTEVTHIYRGYGATRLECISGSPRSGKGFQGEDVTPRNKVFYILD